MSVQGSLCTGQPGVRITQRSTEPAQGALGRDCDSFGLRKQVFQGDVSSVLGPVEAGLDAPTFIESASESLFLRRRTAKALLALSPREERVLRLRFGFNCPEHTLDQVAEDLAVSRERVRQIEAKALRKLRHPSQSRSLGGRFSGGAKTRKRAVPTAALPAFPPTGRYSVQIDGKRVRAEVYHWSWVPRGTHVDLGDGPYAYFILDGTQWIAAAHELRRIMRPELHSSSASA